MPITITIRDILRKTATIDNAIAVDADGAFITQNAARLIPLTEDVETLFGDLQQRTTTEQVEAAIEAIFQTIEVYKKFFSPENSRELWYPNVLHLGTAIHNTLAVRAVRRELEEKLTPDALQQTYDLVRPRRLPIFVNRAPRDREGLRRPVPRTPQDRSRLRAQKRPRSPQPDSSSPRR